MARKLKRRILMKNSEMLRKTKCSKERLKAWKRSIGQLSILSTP